MKKNLFFAFALLVIISCNQQEVDTKAEGEKLMQVSREWSKAAASRDPEKVLSYWTDDAVLISAGQPTLIGKAAIREMVEGGFKDPGFMISWEPTSAEVSKSGDLGYLLEDSQITMKDSAGGQTVQHFKSVTNWKKQADGSWKCVVDVMSPVDPMPK